MRESLLAVVLLLAGVVCVANGQQPYQPPQQYAIVGYQPVIQSGQWYVVRRPLWVVDWVFGPQTVFIPQQPIQPR
jgi:hypothetical protein